jgi:peroxiredoxin
VSDAAPPARTIVAGKIGTTLLCFYLLAVALRVGGCYHADPGVQDALPDAGPRVGETFPDFTLPDVSGPRITLQDLAGRPAVLAFVPSLDWSAPSKARVLDLADAVAGRHDVTLAIILTVGAATPRSLTFAREHRIPAYVLVDGDGLAERLGLAIGGPEGAPVALPATFVLDAGGGVLLRDVRRDPRTWLDPDAILTAARLSPYP